MADFVNLRTYRKQSKRRQSEEKAAANRLAHGLTKHERQANKARREKAASDLDRHRIEKRDS